VPFLRDPEGLHPAPVRKCPPLGDCKIDFPFQDELLLEDLHAHGGRIWIPAQAREQPGSYPLVVLLHGIELPEQTELPHRLLAPPLDLSRPVKALIEDEVVPPVLLAAPSQTLEADHSRRLWTPEGFDLGDFVDAVDRELAAVSRVRVLWRDVSVLGHSGAGCVLTPTKQNGLFAVARRLEPLRAQGIHLRLLGLMDICFLGEAGGRFLAHHLRPTSTRLFAMWVEPERWRPSLDREIEDFARGLSLARPVACPLHRYKSCLTNARGDRLYQARIEGLRYAFASRLAADDGLEPHDLLTLWFIQEALRIYFSDRPDAVPPRPAAPPWPAIP
jgi:hypothetical protein